MHIRIADVDFLIASESLPLEFKNHLSAHTPFLTDTSDIDALTDNINITCFLNSFPPTDSFQKIFQAEDSWSMLKDGEEYFLEIGSGSKETVCMARFDRQVRQVTVYCGNALLDNVNGRKKLINPFSYPLDQLLFMYAMAEREGILVHASSVLINGRGYLFAGRSGAGKSTISNCFKLAGYEILNDDRIAIRRIGDRFRVFGTPWPGEADIAVNNSACLEGIFFIRHGSENTSDATGLKGSHRKADACNFHPVV